MNPQKHNQQSNGIKKKCHGNRKLQRFKAKLRKRGFDVKSTMILLNGDHTNKSISQETIIRCPITFNQAIMKRQLSTKQTNVTIDKSIFTTQQKLILKPNYLNMSDISFKQMLSTVFDGSEFIIQYLDTKEKLNSTRNYTQLLSNFYCLKYEQDLWQTYADISMIAGVWSTTTTITKEVAFENNLNRYLFTTRVNTEKHQKIIMDQLKKIRYELNEYQQQHMDSLAIDKKLLIKVITTLVLTELHKLRTEYEWEKVLFQYDANDYRLVKLFYDFKPTKDQIHSAKFIWQMTVYQLKVEEQLILASQCLQKIDQWNDNRMIYSIKQTEETIDNYKKIIHDEKKKLLNEQTIISLSTLVHLMDIITLRQNNMHEHTQHLLKCQMRFNN